MITANPNRTKKEVPRIVSFSVSFRESSLIMISVVPNTENTENKVTMLMT